MSQARGKAVARCGAPGRAGSPAALEGMRYEEAGELNRHAEPGNPTQHRPAAGRHPLRVQPDAHRSRLILILAETAGHNQGLGAQRSLVHRTTDMESGRVLEQARLGAGIPRRLQVASICWWDSCKETGAFVVSVIHFLNSTFSEALLSTWPCPIALLVSPRVCTSSPCSWVSHLDGACSMVFVTASSPHWPGRQWGCSR
jgi:hypothetical protein